jgi:hypothetical protein
MDWQSIKGTIYDQEAHTRFQQFFAPKLGDADVLRAAHLL